MKAKLRGYKVRTCGPMTWIEPPIEKSAVSIRERVVASLVNAMKDIYMKNVLTFEVHGKPEEYGSDIEGDIVRETMRLIRYNNGQHLNFKVMTNDITMYCVLEPLDGSSVIINAIAYGSDMVIAHSFVGSNEPYYHLSDSSGPVAFSKDQDKLNAFINQSISKSTILPGDDFPFTDTSDEFINYLRAVIKYLRKHYNDESCMLVSRPFHTPMEMYTIQELYRNDKRSHGVPIPSIVEWTFKGNIEDNDGFTSLKKGSITPSLHTDENPLVDLGERSFNSIIRYVKKNGYMFQDTYEGIKKNVDMTRCISGGRYGSQFIYPLKVNGETINSQLVFALHNDNGCLMLDIPYGGVYYILTILFDNMHQFNLYNNIITVNLSGTVLNHAILPTNADQCDAMIPLEFRQIEDVIALIYRICALFITIYERPKRTRVVQERRRVQKGEGTEGEEKDYVIRRIMKSETEAKKYISTMSAQYKDREYTMMSWDRVGHTRQLKNGRIVYVSACHCYRRLPLSDKKIHLQL